MGDVLNRGSKDRPRWYARYIDTDGRRKQRATHQPTKALALRFVAEVEARIAAGKVGMEVPTKAEIAAKAITVAELIEKFLADFSSPRIKDIEVYRGNAKSALKHRVLPSLGNRPAASLTPLDVERLRDGELAGGLAPGSVGQTLRHLGKLYTWARKIGLVDCPHPVAGVERPRGAQSLDFLSHVEVGKLLAHAEVAAPALHPMIATGVYAGLRKGCLFGLRWVDVVLDAGRLDVNRSYRGLPKNGKVRHLPLHPELAVILRRWRDVCPATPEGLVFPVEAAPGRYRMGEQRDAIGLPELLAGAGCHVPAKPWHALRHTFAAHAVMAGISLYTVQKLLGHHDATMTQVYAHLAPDFLAGEMARLSFPRPTTADVADLGEARRLKSLPSTSA